MKRPTRAAIFIAVIAILILAWIVHFHSPAVAAVLPKWTWLQSTITHLGTAPEAPDTSDEDPDNAKNEIPVHTAQITTATLHRYVDAFGTVTPRPARPGEPAGAANVASPVAGVVAKVLCQIGQHVHANEPLIQLDDRLAKAAEDQAAAALAQAQASLAALKATPRPDQLQIAQLAVQKSESALKLAQENFNRTKRLAEEQVTSGKTLQQAQADLAAAQNDLAVNQNQLALLKNTPTPEDLAQEQAKVAQAAAALAAARTQRQMMTIAAPIDATVTAVNVNPGEPVDPAKTLVQLINTDRLAVNVEVPADQLPPDPLSLPAQVLTPTTTATTEPTTDQSPLIGKVALVSPQVDPRTGAVMLAVDLPPDPALRPGLSVRVRVVATEHKNVLAVPRDAVVTDENGDSVIAVVDNDQATHKTVKPGLEENGLIEITADGLSEGMTVVTAGAFGLPQASRVKIIN